jgi:outer membrane protein OmpA-like peptidoglycan-associated protein
MSPPPSDDSDRDRILARRAIFVSTALAALGCSSQSTPQQNPPPDGSVVTIPSSSSAPAVSAAPTANAPSTLRSWDDVMAAAPPLDIAPKLNDADKQDLEQLRQRLAPTYDALAAAWKGISTSCGPKDCAKEWSAAADAILQARDALKPSLCGTYGGIGYRQRLAEHEVFLFTNTKELEDGLTDAAMKLGDATTWPRMVSRPPLPQPCLKCAMPREPGVVEGAGILSLSFADGSSKLTPEAEEALKRVPLEAALVIRGHADPSEADAAKLSLARAEAVKKALVKKGAKAKSLTVVAIGADLPIASPKTPEGKAKNRRVEFAFPPEAAK